MYERHRQTGQTGQTDRQDRQRTDSIGQTVLQTIAQKTEERTGAITKMQRFIKYVTTAADHSHFILTNN